MVGEHNIVFYADDGHIAGQNPIWVHTTLKVMVGIFKRVGLRRNIGKTNLGKTGESSVQEKINGGGGHGPGVEENQGKLQGVRGGAMTASSLCHHMERTHGIVLPQTRGVDIGRGILETYMV